MTRERVRLGKESPNNKVTMILIGIFDYGIEILFALIWDFLLPLFLGIEIFVCPDLGFLITLIFRD